MSSFRSDNKFLINFIKGILILLICIPLGITAVRYSAWKMILFLIFWILFPGIFVDKYLLKQEFEDLGMLLLSGFYVGTAVTFAEWFVLYVLGLRQMLMFINPCLTMVFGIWYLGKRLRGRSSASKLQYNIDIPFLIALLAATYLCAYYTIFQMPRAIDIGSVDMTWQIGNINQFASDIPLRDIRVAGVKVRYHFFTALFLGIAKYIFGGEGWIYFSQYMIWFLPFIITVSLRKLYEKVIQNSYFVSAMAIATMVGFSLNDSYGLWDCHLFSNITGVGMAAPCLILLFLNLWKTEETFSIKQKLEKKHVLWLIHELLLLFVLTGAKGPFALLYVLALCVWIIILIFKRKVQDGKAFVFVLANFFAFYVIFHFLLAVGTQGYFSELTQDTVLQPAVRGKELLSLYERLGIDGIGGRALFLLPSLAATFTFLTPFGILALYDLIKFFLGKKELKNEVVYAYVLAGGGLCAYYLFKIEGNSQLYFLFTAIPFVGYLCFYKAFEMIKKGTWRIVFCGITFILTICVMNSNLLPASMAIPDMVMCYLKNSYPEAERERILAFGAYDFLRENTDKNAMIATNIDAGTFHCISAFAERRCYMEGYIYSEQNFGFADREKRLQEMRNLFGVEWSDSDRFGFCEEYEIDYLVFFKEKSDAVGDVEPLKSSDHFQLVYENEAISIFDTGR